MAGKKRSRFDYLDLAADRVAKAAYTAAKGLGASPDLKALKEVEAVLKEAVNVALSLEKSDYAEAREIRVVFEDETEAFAG